jgi:hypothetical protein
MDLHRDTQSTESPDDLVACSPDVVRVLAAERREALDERPGLVEGDSGEGCGDVLG